RRARRGREGKRLEALGVRGCDVLRLVAAMALTAACLTMSAAATAVGSGSRAAATREQSTQLISRARGGGRPNGPSTNAVISGDERYARVIAFQSLGSNL